MKKLIGWSLIAFIVALAYFGLTTNDPNVKGLVGFIIFMVPASIFWAWL